MLTKREREHIEGNYPDGRGDALDLLDDVNELRDLLQEAVDVTEEHNSLAEWRAEIQKVLDG